MLLSQSWSELVTTNIETAEYTFSAFLSLFFNSCYWGLRGNLSFLIQHLQRCISVTKFSSKNCTSNKFNKSENIQSVAMISKFCIYCGGEMHFAQEFQKSLKKKLLERHLENETSLTHALHKISPVCLIDYNNCKIF